MLLKRDVLFLTLNPDFTYVLQKQWDMHFNLLDKHLYITFLTNSHAKTKPCLFSPKTRDTHCSRLGLLSKYHKPERSFRLEGTIA